MKVILQRDIPKLGKGGEVVNVADGYARNYLFPRGHAVPATGGFLKHHQARIEHERTLGDKLHADAESNARKLDGLTVVITGKVGSGTKLYGSVTAQDVADAIKKATGIEVDKRRVGLVDPIKTLGVYAIPVRLGAEITATVHVDVTTEEELSRRAAEEARQQQSEAACDSDMDAEGATAEAV